MRRAKRAKAKTAPRRKPVRSIRSIAQLKPDPKNARKHGARNVSAIAAALKEVGAARSIVIDEAGVVLAGNATVEAMVEAGLSKVKIIDADGDTLVAVRRSGLSRSEKTRLALFDNRTSELAEGWNLDILEEFKGAGLNLEGLWTPEELAELLAGRGNRGRTDPDALPPPRETSIKPGDLFDLGRHRVRCGDSTQGSDVAQLLRGDKPELMVTDPPYGVKYDPEWRRNAGVNNSERMGRVVNDDRSDWSEAWKLFPGDAVYVWHAGVFASIVEQSITAAGFEIRSQIIWRKTRIVLSRGHYHWQHEPCWYAVRKGRTALWAGKRTQTTVWPIAGVHRCQSCGAVESEIPLDAFPSTIWDIDSKDQTGETTHGTQKPVECMARPMRNHAAPLIYDPFLGSGTSIIAAEMIGRACRAMEIDPGYLQQAIDRWELFTGLKAIKVGEAVLA